MLCSCRWARLVSDRFVSFDDKITCLEREIKMRQYVYPHRVEQKKMTQDQADKEIDIMRAVLKDILKLSGRTPAQGRLF